MSLLRRHQLAWPTEAGWQRLLARPWDAEARAALQHWAGHGLPLVVARGQPAPDELALGLAAPACWGRRRLALGLRWDELRYLDDFPGLPALARSRPPWQRPPLRRLQTRLRAAGLRAHVYGSHGWQLISGLEHLRPGSDLDLWLPVDDCAQADAAAAVLASFEAWPGLPRLDGELVFPDGRAVAWREWRQQRARQPSGPVLVKRLDGQALQAAVPAVFDRPWPASLGLDAPSLDRVERLTPWVGPTRAARPTPGLPPAPRLTALA